jgi:hypothetical protein
MFVASSKQLSLYVDKKYVWVCEEHCILMENWKIGNKSNVHVLTSDVEIHE